MYDELEVPSDDTWRQSPSTEWHNNAYLSCVLVALYFLMSGSAVVNSGYVWIYNLSYCAIFNED